MTLLLHEKNEKGATAALIKDNLLLEYLNLDKEEALAPEGVYLGKVGRVMKNLNACFVSLPGGQEGFLPYGKVRVMPGDVVLVQLKRPGVGGKTPHLTRDIALTGRTLVYLPFGMGDKVSSRVEDRQQRQRLKGLAATLTRDEGAFIMRHMSLTAEEQTIRQEAEALLSAWQLLKERAQKISPPALLQPPPHSLARLLRDLQEEVDAVVSNDVDSLAALNLPLRYHPSPMALYDVPGKLRRALKRKVYLKSGASLIIDPCEAMTVIDVNSDKCTVGSRCTKVEVNKEAAGEIARLLRLRGIGGIVLIDFIDMETPEERQQVLAVLEEHLKRDRVKTTVQGFTALGLVEMTRKRAEDAQRVEKGICPYCQGSGLKPLMEEAL